MVVLWSSPDLRLDDGLGSIYALWVIPLNPPTRHVARVLTKAYSLFWQGPETNLRVAISGSFSTFFALTFRSTILKLYPVIPFPNSNSSHVARWSWMLPKRYPPDQSLIFLILRKVSEPPLVRDLSLVGSLEGLHFFKYMYGRWGLKSMGNWEFESPWRLLKDSNVRWVLNEINKQNLFWGSKKPVKYGFRCKMYWWVKGEKLTEENYGYTWAFILWKKILRQIHCMKIEERLVMWYWRKQIPIVICEEWKWKAVTGWSLVLPVLVVLGSFPGSFSCSNWIYIKLFCAFD